jgi:hypothetical protein
MSFLPLAIPLAILSSTMMITFLLALQLAFNAYFYENHVFVYILSAYSNVTLGIQD